MLTPRRETTVLYGYVQRPSTRSTHTKARTFPGCQTTFSYATPAAIRAEVKLRIETLGPAGLVLSPTYDLNEPDVPWANIAAFLEAARAYG